MAAVEAMYDILINTSSCHNYFYPTIQTMHFIEQHLYFYSHVENISGNSFP